MTVTLKVRWITVFFVLAIWAVFPSSVLSKSPTQPVAKECPVVNTFKTIEIAFCTNEENSESYYINTMGFMLPESN
jgi:hypothetical protein